MIVKQILSRIYVNNMNSAIDFYERLTNEKCAMRFEHKQVGLEIARISNLLIVAGNDNALEPFKATSATFLVDSVSEYKEFLIENKAEIIRDIQNVPTGFNMTIKHYDGVVIEYVEFKK